MSTIDNEDSIVYQIDSILEELPIKKNAKSGRMNEKKNISSLLINYLQFVIRKYGNGKNQFIISFKSCFKLYN